MIRASLTVAAALAALGTLGYFAIAVADPSADKVADEAKKKRAPPPRTPTPQEVADAKVAWGDVYRVLQSPRCINCHPADGAPKQTDNGVPHAMNISRLSAESGLACSTCHSTKNSEDTIGLAGGPPGALHWGLPPKDTPMVFENHTPTSLCVQLKDPEHNGKRSLADLVHHVSHDALVLWGWNPGGNRTVPPMSHKAFVAAMTRWAKGGGACPEPAVRQP